MPRHLPNISRNSSKQRLILTEEQKGTLRVRYEATKRTVDDLPYTDEFETLCTEFVARTGLTMTRHDVWRALSNASLK